MPDRTGQRRPVATAIRRMKGLHRAPDFAAGIRRLAGSALQGEQREEQQESHIQSLVSFQNKVSVLVLVMKHSRKSILINALRNNTVLNLQARTTPPA